MFAHLRNSGNSSSAPRAMASPLPLSPSPHMASQASPSPLDHTMKDGRMTWGHRTCERLASPISSPSRSKKTSLSRSHVVTVRHFIIQFRLFFPFSDSRLSVFMVSHLVSSFLQLPFRDGPDPSLDETLYVFLRNISPPRAHKSLCEHSHFSVVIFLQVLERGTIDRFILASSKCSRSPHSPFHRRQWRNVSFTSLSETCLTLVSGLDSSGERFISLPDNADRTLQITAGPRLLPRPKVTGAGRTSHADDAAFRP